MFVVFSFCALVGSGTILLTSCYTTGVIRKGGPDFVLKAAECRFEVLAGLPDVLNQHDFPLRIGFDIQAT